MKTILSLLLATFLLVSSHSAFGSHAAAVDLGYECLGNGQYRFTLKTYRDCSGIGLDSIATIDFSSVSCGITGNFDLTLDSIREVALICDALITQTTCGNGGNPGIEEYTYSAIFTIPDSCADWVFSYEICCRNLSITNIQTSGFNLFTDVNINNLNGTCNSSPRIQQIPISYSCVNQPVSFNNLVVDPDGDSLSFALVNPRSSANLNIPYAPGSSFSPSNPLSTTAGFNFDSITGQIEFVSPSLQRVIVSVLITEYDSNNNVKGTTLRDIYFVIINCFDPTFQANITRVITDSSTMDISTCYGEPVCFEIFGTTQDTNKPNLITYGNNLPNSTFTTRVSNDTTYGTFCWDPMNSTGDHYVSFISEIDRCPLKSIKMFTYKISIDTVFGLCNDTTIYLSQNGQATIDSSYVFQSQSGQCSLSSVQLQKELFTCADAGVNTISVIQYYGNGLTNTCMVNVTVLDTFPPTAVCQDITVSLQANGTVVINPSQINNNSTDNCGINSLAIDRNTFSCQDIGANTVKLIVTDNYGNTDTCSAQVTVVDNAPPTIVCNNAVVYLNSMSQVVIDSSLLIDTVFDHCTSVTVWLEKYSFDCAEVGVTQVKVFASDTYGNIDSCVALLTILDTIPPVAICKDTLVYLDSNGIAVIDSSFLNNASSDNCEIDRMTISQEQFDCRYLGQNTVQLIVTDKNGNTDTCESIVTILDTLQLRGTCRDTTIYLDSTGNIDITLFAGNLMSTNKCGSYSTTSSFYSFTCEDIGVHQVTLYVSDSTGILDSCVSQITVLDNIAPVITCTDTTVYLNSMGNVVIDSSYLFSSAWDNCEVYSIHISKDSFDCGDHGQQSVTITATDSSGNTYTCISIVTVLDTILPVVVCRDTTVYLDSNGVVVIDISFVDNNSADNCQISSLYLSQTTFDCFDVGTNNVQLIGRDFGNNYDTCFAVVTILDTFSVGEGFCADTTLYLDANGIVVLDSAVLYSNFANQCVSFNLTATQDTFECSDRGVNQVTIFLSNSTGVIDSCQATITILDTIPPVVRCKEDTVYLNSNNLAYIDASSLNDGSTDNCAIQRMTLDRFRFSCADLGRQPVTLYLQDINGNTDSCSSWVTVLDSIKPTVLCTDTIVYLNAQGISVIDSSFVFAGGSDNCLVGSITLSQDTFDCSSMGLNSVLITIQDVSGNVNTCSAQVQVVDTTKPIFQCLPGSVYLDADGVATINVSDLVGNSFSNCGTNEITVDIDTFSCADIGVNTVTLYIRDASGNSDSCQTTVEVLDTFSFAPNAGNDIALCSVDSVLLVAIPFSTNSQGYWTKRVIGPNRLMYDSILTNPLVSQLSLGVSNFVWNESIGQGCQLFRDTLTVLRNDSVVADAGNDTVLCGVFTYQLEGNPTNPNETGKWYLDTTFSQPNIPVIQNDSIENPVVTGLVQGEYRFVRKIENETCPPAYDSVVVRIYGSSVADAGFDSAYCSPISITLSGSPLANLETGLWILDTTNLDPNNIPTLVSPSSPVTQITNLDEGTYRFIWQITSGSCFVNSDTVAITVYNQPIALLGADQNLCDESQAIFTAAPLSGSATGNWVNFFNSPGSLATFSTNQDSAFLGNMQEGEAHHFYYEATNGTCPPSRDTICIINNYVPQVTIGSDVTKVCQLSCVKFSMDSLVTGDSLASVNWLIAGVGFAENNPPVNFGLPGTYDASLTVTTIYGCATTVTNLDMITVMENPIADFQVEIMAAGDRETKIEIEDRSRGAEFYTYYFGNGDSSSMSEPIYEYPMVDEYQIMQVVSDSMGCTDSATQDVVVKDFNVFMPNSFTPNGDNVNDVFLPSLDHSQVEEYYLSVYNRWGEEIFYTDVTSHGWDGTYKGEENQNGVYVWQLSVKRKDDLETREMRGHINLIR